MFTHVDVEANPSSPMAANQVYKNLSDPRRVARVRLFEGKADGELFEVTGWSSVAGGSPVDAFCVRVEDSSAGWAFLVYGGDWGLRLRPAGSSGPWAAADPGQTGESHLVLSDSDDIILVDA